MLPSGLQSIRKAPRVLKLRYVTRKISEYESITSPLPAFTLIVALLLQITLKKLIDSPLFSWYIPSDVTFPFRLAACC